MKKVLFFFATLLAFGQNAFAYSNLTAVAPSGQTLYYKWNDTYNGFVVTYPGSSEVSPYSINGCNYTMPSGDLVIPTTVTYLGRTYSVDEVGMFAFKGCTGLTSVTFDSSGYISISGCAFENCTGLSSINIPASVHGIVYGAFQGCTNLTSITVTSGNTVFDSRNNCNAIIRTSANILVIGCKNTVIPNSVTGICSDSFRGCTGLTSINIPSCVTWIGDHSFAGCTGLTSMTINSTVPPSVCTSTFDYVPRNILMYVPTASISSYQSASVWSEFTNYIGIGMSAYTINVVSSNPSMGTVSGGGSYGAGNTVTLTATPNWGYHFTQWQDGNTQNPRTITVTGDATYTAYFDANAPVNSATVSATISEIESTSAHADIVKGQHTSYFYYFYGPQSAFTQNELTTDEAIISYVNQNYDASERNYNHVSGYMNGLTPNTAYLLVVVPYNSNDEVGTITRKQFTTLNTNGIEDASEETVAIGCKDGRLTVGGAEGEMVSVYSIDGRRVCSLRATETTVIDVPTAGVYLVKVGDTLARKVVVIR